MDEKTLVLVFNTENGGLWEMTVKDPDPDLDETDIQTAMNTIISKKIFENKTGDLDSMNRAYVIDSFVTEYDILA